MLSAGNQLGKALRNDMLVLTVYGWKKICDLSVGEMVVSSDGNSYPVTGVYPQGEKYTYEVVFEDGRSVVCCDDHLWKCKQGKRERFGDGGYSVRSLKQIIEYGGLEPKSFRRATVPSVVVNDIHGKDLLIPPYLLGVILGDGCISNDTISISNPDEEIREIVRKDVDSMNCGLYLSEPYRGISYSISCNVNRCKETGRFEKTNKLKEILESYGLMGKLSYSKFIPDDYLLQCKENRLSLLQGLLDTDGYCGEDGCIEYSTTSDTLSKQVQYIVRSLGGKCKIYKRKSFYNKDGVRKQVRDSYRVKIRCDNTDLFKVKRKADRLRKVSYITSDLIMVEINPKGLAECTCITVDSPDNTFITNDFIVTHNSEAGASEMAMHLTGNYPDWYEGKRFDCVGTYWIGGETAELVRDTCQKKLFGKASEIGNGILPRDSIVEIKNLSGVSGAIDYAIIKHKSGGNNIVKFKTYSMGREKWQAESCLCVWLDEEPDRDIYEEALSRTNATGGILYMTFTPLNGMTPIVKQFWNESHPDRALVRMDIYDAKHISPEQREKIIASYPPHQRKARIEGIPVLGSGLVFPVNRESISYTPFEIPRYWGRIVGIDFGWDHPTAVVWLAHDRDTDTIYVYDCYRAKEKPVAEHASAIRMKGDWIPVAWPHDGLQHDKGSGEQLGSLYRKHGVFMLPERATFEDGSNGVEAGNAEILDRFNSGRMKIARHLGDIFEELDIYHRKDGKLVKETDDLLSALRYAIMMLRYAMTEAEVDVSDDYYEDDYSGRDLVSGY